MKEKQDKYFILIFRILL